MGKIIITYKSNVTIQGDLPTSTNAYGDVRLVKATGIQYYWSLPGSSGANSDWIPVNAEVAVGGGGGGDGTDEEARRRSWFGL